jgi:hypothetical protein
MARKLCAIGHAWARHAGRADGDEGVVLFGETVRAEEGRIVEQLLELYDECCDKATAAIDCWIASARRLRLSKDTRGLICDLLWEQRDKWLVAVQVERESRIERRKRAAR